MYLVINIITGKGAYFWGV